MQTILIKTATGQQVATSVTLARSFWSRARGLLMRRALKQDEGLLLEPGGSIHTVGMRFAIDALFLDERRRVLRIVPHLVPHRFARAPRGTRAVLEVAAGRAAVCAIEPGAYLICQGAS
ncbi:MAG TPA: DUF192 domain-containing protein [Povalibacter sp.]|jgi:uncharacterized protein